jgi:hypothetical protein
MDCIVCDCGCVDCFVVSILKRDWLHVFGLAFEPDGINFWNNWRAGNLGFPE